MSGFECMLPVRKSLKKNEQTPKITPDLQVNNARLPFDHIHFHKRSMMAGICSSFHILTGSNIGCFLHYFIPESPQFGKIKVKRQGLRTRVDSDISRVETNCPNIRAKSNIAQPKECFRGSNSRRRRFNFSFFSDLLRNTARSHTAPRPFAMPPDRDRRNDSIATQPGGSYRLPVVLKAVLFLLSWLIKEKERRPIKIDGIFSFDDLWSFSGGRHCIVWFLLQTPTANFGVAWSLSQGSITEA